MMFSRKIKMGNCRLSNMFKSFGSSFSFDILKEVKNYQISNNEILVISI